MEWAGQGRPQGGGGLLQVTRKDGPPGDPPVHPSPTRCMSTAIHGPTHPLPAAHLSIIHPSTGSPIQPLLHPPTNHLYPLVLLHPPSGQPLTHSFLYPLIPIPPSFVHPPACPPSDINLLIRPPAHRPFIHPHTHLPTHPPSYMPPHPPTHSFIHPNIHSSMHLSTTAPPDSRPSSHLPIQP